MYCHNTALLNAHLRENDKIVEQDRYIDSLAREKAEELVQSIPDGDNYQLIITGIYDNEIFTKQFDELVHAVVNNASIESVENLQKFIFEMAYEVARKSLEKHLTRINEYFENR